MIHHHPPPTRGCAMKFIRRSDLEPQTRIDIVRLAWQGQGIYGKMTQLARAYHISRTFLYQMTGAAYRQLEILFSDSKDLVQAPQPLLEPLMLLLRLEGTCSIPSLSSILTYFQYRPNSVGYLSECFQTSLTDASNWSAKPMLPLPKRPRPRPPSTTPKARPIYTSVSSAMIRRTARVSTPWPATISSISCSICCARLYTCVRLSVGSVRLKASARN